MNFDPGRAAPLFPTDSSVRDAGQIEPMCMFFEQSPLPMHRLDPQGNTIAVNHAFQRLFGVTAADMAGYNPLTDERLPTGKARELLLRTFGGETTRTGRVRAQASFLPPRGEGQREFWIEGIGCPLKDDDGTVMEVVLILHDVTAQVEAERLQRAFIATLAHELRNPLAPICNAVDLLRAESRNRERLTRVTAMLGRQVDQVVRLVDDLYDFGRSEFGRVDLNKEQAAIAAIVAHAIEAVQRSVDEAGIEITLEEIAPDLRVEVDVLRITQVLCNLLVNACKFTPRGGKVVVAARPSQQEVAIIVSDNGIGIDPAHLESIFNLFGQAPASPLQPKAGGLGIGLTLARTLVELHGGRLEARSDGVGRGSEFRVILPLWQK